MKKDFRLILIFSIIFVVGIIVSYITPLYVDGMISLLTDLHSDVKVDGAFTTMLTDTARIDQLIPYVAPAGYVVSAGLQLLGISGIVAAILKKDK